MYEKICLVTRQRLHYTPAYTLNLLESTLPVSSYNRLSTISGEFKHINNRRIKETNKDVFSNGE